MTYRKKPVEVEAFKIGSDDIPEWFSKELQAGNVSYNEAFYIKTLAGVMKADNGDYIIKGVKGEIYPCKPDIFEATYEKVIKDKQ